jgi:outer membrane protein assembly factor BamD (BamD/ComL family)
MNDPLYDRRLLPPASEENSLTLTFPDGYTTVVPMRRTRYSLVLLTAAAFLVVSCSEKLAQQPGLSDTALFTRGQQYLAKEKYEKAIEHFKVLLERFPNSPLAPKAQLALADAYRGNKDNLESEVAYDDFIRLYPANDNVPYALFQKGDPAGPYAETATRRVKELRNRLAEHEVYVVTHYLTRRKPDSAEARAKRALSDYPDTTSVPTLMSLLAEALADEGKKEEAATVSKNLREKYLGPGVKKR